MAKEKSRVLLVDDDEHLRDAIEVKLRNEGYEVLVEPDGRRFKDAVEEHRPDVVILDVRLPTGPDGFELGRALRELSADQPLLYLSAADSVADRLEGFSSGADDYLCKPFAMAELLARIEALLRRAGRLPTTVYTIADLEVRPAKQEAKRGHVVVPLTPREFDVLHVLARHAGQVLSKEQLLDHVWGFEVRDHNVVEVHISSLRRKMEAHGPRLVHTERNGGYILRP